MASRNGDGDAVLHAAQRIEEFALRQHLGLAPEVAGQTTDPHYWRVADGIENRLVDPSPAELVQDDPGGAIFVHLPLQRARAMGEYRIP